MQLEKKAMVFQKTYDAYSSRMRGHLYNSITNMDEADDIFQDIFADFWKALDRFKGESEPSTFLYIIMKRRIADYLRKKYRYSKARNSRRWGTFNVGVNPLNLLIALCRGDERDLLLAVKKTIERGEEQ